MAKQVLNNGESGLIIRGKINDNFTELYTGKDSVTVANFAALPAPASATDEKWWCLASQGVYLINRRPAGSYYSDGATWTWLGDNPTSANQISNTPAGGIAATDVQAALNELDADKLNIGGTAALATALATGRTISTTGDVIYTSPAFNGTANVSAAATIPNDTVTFAKMQNASAASVLVGRGQGSGSGDLQEITLGANLSMTGTVLNATGGGSSNEYFLYQDVQRTLTNTVALQQLFNQTTNGAFTPPSTGLYQVEGMFIVVGMSATTGNAQFDIRGAGTATLAGQMMHFVGVDNNSSVASAARTGSGIRGTNASATLVVATGTGTEMLVEFNGVFKVTATGTIIPSIALTTAGAVILSAGSYIRFKKLADASVFASAEFS